MRFGLAAAAGRIWGCCIVALAALAPAAAHDIPNDVLIQAYIKPAGDRLQLLVRVPLAAMREVDVPLRGPGYLDLSRVEPALRHAAGLYLVDNIDIYEDGTRLGAPRVLQARVSLASDKSFASYEAAVARVLGPRLPADMDLYWNQQLMDVLLEYPIASDRAAFAVHCRFARLGLQVVTALRFLPPDGAERAFELRGDAGLVQLDPHWHQAAWRFVKSGCAHILDGMDHLLFLLCLVIPFRRWRPLIVIVTSFTVAHSITLIASAFGVAPGGLWFPPLIETLIALSIVYMALENIVGANAQRRWIITFMFGLVHGFGFSFALQDTLQFAGSHLLTSLFAFNVGVELGQLLVLALIIPVLNVAFRYLPDRVGTIILSAFIAHTGWHWLLERGAQLAKFPVPALDLASAASGVRWLLVAVIVAAVLWSMNGRVRQWMEIDRRRGGDSGASDVVTANLSRDASPAKR